MSEDFLYVEITDKKDAEEKCINYLQAMGVTDIDRSLIFELVQECRRCEQVISNYKSIMEQRRKKASQTNSTQKSTTGPQRSLPQTRNFTSGKVRDPKKPNLIGDDSTTQQHRYASGSDPRRTYHSRPGPRKVAPYSAKTPNYYNQSRQTRPSDNQTTLYAQTTGPAVNHSKNTAQSSADSPWNTIAIDNDNKQQATSQQQQPLQQATPQTPPQQQLQQQQPQPQQQQPVQQPPPQKPTVEVKENIEPPKKEEPKETRLFLPSSLSHIPAPITIFGFFAGPLPPPPTKLPEQPIKPKISISEAKSQDIFEPLKLFETKECQSTECLTQEEPPILKPTQNSYEQQQIQMMQKQQQQMPIMPPCPMPFGYPSMYTPIPMQPQQGNEMMSNNMMAGFPYHQMAMPQMPTPVDSDGQPQMPPQFPFVYNCNWPYMQGPYNQVYPQMNFGVPNQVQKIPNPAQGQSQPQ